MKTLERQVMPDENERKGQEEVATNAGPNPIHVISLGAGVQSSALPFRVEIAKNRLAGNIKP